MNQNLFLLFIRNQYDAERPLREKSGARLVSYEAGALFMGWGVPVPQFTVSTLMRFVLPEVLFVMPPVMTTLSPGLSENTCFAVRSA